jgi:hypothetical protein
MPGLVPGIHVLLASKQDVDGRDKPGHDGSRSPLVSAFAGTTRDLQLHHALAAVLAGEQSDQRLRGVLQSGDDIFLHLQLAGLHP